ncbi:MAG TPA: MATE family efflux transporter [Polyangiaceae bacterium]|nr:MATE family efflux transporter [Polyangiaceae bacterium]
MKNRAYYRKRRRVASARPRGNGKRPTPSPSPRGAIRARDAVRELLTLAWPIAAAMLGETALGLVDTKITGGLGASALGGVGLATTLMYALYAFAWGAMRAVKVRASHAIGEGAPNKGFAYARAGVLMGLVYGFGVAAVMRHPGPLLHLVGANDALLPYATDFLRALAFGAPATCASAALIQHRQGMGHVRLTMIVGIAANALNATLAVSLVYGKLGLPALGVAGAGYATAITKTSELALLGALLVRDEARARRSAAKSRAIAPLAFGVALREVASLGAPTGLQFAGELLAFTTFTAVLGSLGAHEIAAHQIALSTIRVSFLPGIAVSEATSVLVGRALGERRVDRADAATRAGLGVAMAFMSLCGIGFAVFGGSLARFFSPDERVVVVATRLLWVASVFQLLDAANIVLRGALRGAKDVAGVAAIGLFATWAFIPTAAYVLGKRLELGALGGWLGFVAETAVSAGLFWWRWKRGSWRLRLAAA